MAEEVIDQPKRTRVNNVVTRHLNADASEFLTLEYVVAMGSIIATIVCLAAAIKAACTLWNDSTVSLGVPFDWILPVSNGYVGAMWAGLAAVVFALSALFFGRRTVASIAARPGYESRLVYKVITYATLAISAVWLLIALVTFFTVIITSLLLIGSESSIGSLYANVFIPTLLNSLVAGFATYVLYRFAKGRGAMTRLNLLLLAATSVTLLALIVTVAVRSHDAYSANDYGRVDRSMINNDNRPTLYRY
jgi:hypothetical protein